MPEDAKLTKPNKPAGKSSKSSKSTIIAAATTSRFRKRQTSETSTSGGQGRSAFESILDYSSPSPDNPGRTASRSTVTLDESSSSGTDDSPPNGVRGQVRLVRSLRPEDHALAIDSAPMGGTMMGTVLEATEHLAQAPEAIVSLPSTPTKPLHDQVGTTPPPSNPDTLNISKSRGHWNQLRNLYFTGSAPSVATPASFVDPSRAGTVPPARPQTPKPSRFPRLGFRQIVEQTREVIQGDSSKLHADIYQACMSARIGYTRQKAERDGSQGGHLPFMSASSLPLSVAPSTSQTGKIGSAQANDVVWRSSRSLKLLHETLFRYASLLGSVDSAASLPYESEVLSVLLIPFTWESSKRVDEERLLAVESFEIAFQTWRVSSPQCEIDRIIWCCKAALIPASTMRSRVVRILSTILSSCMPLHIGPLALQNILQGLLLLHSICKSTQSSHADEGVVRELLAYVTTGERVELDHQEVEEEYEALWGIQDVDKTVKTHIIAEGVVRCMQNGSESLRRWVLHELVEAYWPSPSEQLTPLCRKIMGRRLSALLQASLTLLNANPHRYLELDVAAVVRLLFRALPELGQFPIPKHVNDSRSLAVELVVELLSIDSYSQRQQIVELVCGWYEDHDGWKQCLEIGISLFIEHAEWPQLVKVLRNVVHAIPEGGHNVLVPALLSALHIRLVIDPAPYPLPELTLLLRSLAQLYPQQFYKPLFNLAGASKDPTLVGHFATVTALAHHLPEFWVYDPEMMSVALMSDIGSAVGKGKSKGGGQVGWGKPRIGQSLIMLELVRCLRRLVSEKNDQSSTSDQLQIQAHHFATKLEARLAILIDAKEKSTLVPFSQRILFSALFLEIRLFTRSLKPATWLPTIVTWVTQSYMGARLHQDDIPSIDVPLSHVGEDAFDEVLSTVSKIQSIHVACWQAPPANIRQRSTVILSPNFDPRISAVRGVDNPRPNSEVIKEREGLLASLPTCVASATLSLLVGVCALLTQKDYRVIGSVLWYHFLDEEDPAIIAPTCFLLTYCFEKAPKEVTDMVETDRHKSDSSTRRAVVQRLMTLFTWRSQLLSQTYIHDRARRRPFKMAQQPIGFVPIDAGSANYVHEQTEEERKGLPGGTLPYVLRKRLAEFGWKQDDQPTDIRLARAKAPISLFPLSQLEYLSLSMQHDNMSTAQSAEHFNQLLRRMSSASGPHSGARRRPVSTPSLVSMFSSMITLAIDPDPIVASAAREAVLLILRDDPVMLCRQVMDTLSSDLSEVGSAVSVLNAFLHIHHRLPPPASHHIFSHLAGFLKHASRYSDNPKALRAFAYITPLLAKLITQVTSLSIRDLRRAKLEIYVFSSGSLWFPPTAPSSTMFPQSIGPLVNPFDEFPPSLVGILMVRTAQNMLLLNMLRHKPQEVLTIRKNLNGIVLPGQNAATKFDIDSFLPQRPSKNIKRSVDYWQISLSYSRSHLLLLGQVYRNMSRNFNDRAELVRHFDGLNTILLAHGNDIGIVSHALIACMIAVTRFKRLVSSSRGFAMFMPCLLKVYTESEGRAGIRQAIQYVSSRFYAIHQEAYVFQSLEIASNILARVEHEREKDWLARNIYQLFSSLKWSQHSLTQDAAGIRGYNMTEERESLISTTVFDEAPRTGPQDPPRGEQLKKILAVGQYEDLFLSLDDFVRLFLTVIAHDPTIVRAQRLLVLLRHMTPHFYNGSNSAREVLRDGINALGSALFAKAPRQRLQENIPGRLLQKGNIEVSYGTNEGTGEPYDAADPCDQMTIRREYLKLIVAYSKMGGELHHEVAQRAVDIVRSLLKDPIRAHPGPECTLISELADSYLSRLSIAPKPAIALLSELAPVTKFLFTSRIDCSSTLDTITGLLQGTELANDNSFVQLIVSQFVQPVLDACYETASENRLLSHPMRPAVVSLVAQVVALGNTDIVDYIEDQPPSPGFLAGIVLPLCATMGTSGAFLTEKKWRHHDHPIKNDTVFFRFLVYAMEACHAKSGEGETERASPLPGFNRRDSQRSKHSSQLANRTSLATLTLVIQILKVIVLRATDGLSRGLVGIWARLARFLEHLLDDGDATFALRSGSSPVPSPLQSPASGERSQAPPLDHHVSPHAARAPRVVDYLAWSLLEFLCCVPSPLTLQMRLWAQEKVHQVDSELKVRETSSPAIGNGSRRLSSSVFARPRRSSTSPDGLRASNGLSTTPSELNLSASSSTDFPAFSRFSTRGSPSWSGPRIIHLGPTKDNHHMLHPTEGSLSRDSILKSLARTSRISSASLIRSTYNRIRLVQICMGYDRLLPAEDPEGDPNDVYLKVWTTASALATIVAETKELMDEFPENFHENIGGDFDFVDVDSG